MNTKNKKCEIVISGVGGKFPESYNVLQLQKKLFAKEDFITEKARWTTDTIGVGKIPEVDTFDRSAFKMHDKLVRATDPTTTQTLERAFESIIDAGMNPFAMSGRNIAVVSASMISDSENTRTGSSHHSLGFSIIGHNRAMVSNRISYTFNFTGPSYSIHSSWPGGVDALQQGAHLISEGLAEAAVVTTANLIFYKATAKEYKDLYMLTPGSRCRSFDANADGICRSECVVSFFLQKKSDAKRNYASLIGLHTECLGLRACSLIHFDSLLEESIRNFYNHNNIDPEDIAYLEADGSGIKYFDVLELNTLAAIYFEKRKKPLMIGSVKSNVGHTDSASVFLGIVKSIIAFETGMIPPNIHYTTPNPDIPALVSKQFQIITEPTKLAGNLISVNGISLGGAVGHVVIKRNDKEKENLAIGELPPDGLHRLILGSARHEEGAMENSKKLQSKPVDVEYTSLVNDVFKTNISGYLWKYFVIVPSAEITYNVKKVENVKLPLWYVFSGMGSQWTGMGRDLLRFPIFAAAVDKCDAVLRPLGVDIYHILTTDDKTVFENILNCFVGIATVQIGLVDMLSALGLEPDGMIGHSVGELGCAYADGCFTAEQMVLAAYARGKASLDSDVIQGMMAAVGLGYKNICGQLPTSIDVACHNGADSCTLSGPTEDVLEYVRHLKEKKVFAKAVSAGNIAYHSRYIEPIAPKLMSALSELIPEPKPRSARWVSSSVPEADWSNAAARLCSAEYHTNNLLNPVLFEEACRHLPKDAVVVEIAPHGLLQAILRRSLGGGCVNVPLTSRQADSGVKHFLEAIGNLYLNNVSLDVNALYPKIEYPVSRGTPYIAPLVTWSHEETWFMDFENFLQMTGNTNFACVEMNETEEDYHLWKQHCVEGQIVISPSQLLVYVWKLLFSTPESFEKEEIALTKVVISRQILLKDFSQNITFTKMRGTSNFGGLLHENGNEIETFLTGRFEDNQYTKLKTLHFEEETKSDEHQHVLVAKTEVLDVLAHFGYQLGQQLQTFRNVMITNEGFCANVEWTGNIAIFLDAIFKLVLFLEMDIQQQFLFPDGFENLQIDPKSFFALEKGTDVFVCYKYHSNVLRCRGLCLTGLSLSSDSTILRQSPSFLWKKRVFVPFISDKMSDLLSASLQLVAEEGLNSWKHKVTTVNVVLITNNNGIKSLIEKPLENCKDSLPNIRMIIQEIDLSQIIENLVFKPNERYLVVGGVEAVQQLTGSADSNVFLLAYIHGSRAVIETSTPEQLKPVFTHSINGVDKLILLRKAVDVKHLRTLELPYDRWLTSLDQLFTSSVDNSQPVIVVSRKLRPEQILPILARQKYAYKLRCVFLDDSAPVFNPSSPLYEEQLRLGLSINRLIGGLWGTDCILRTQLYPEAVSADITSLESSLDINVVGLNTSHFTYRPDHPAEKVEVEYVDYCGTRVEGVRVMGLAHYNSITKTSSPDFAYTWIVPEHWSSEDAATIPSAYSLAYYALYILGNMEVGKKVLVHAGTTPISEACVRVALGGGADLFVTVGSEEKRSSLLQAFPKLNPDQVVLMDRFDITIKLKKKSKSRGMEVIINCLPNAETLTSLSCLGGIRLVFIHLSNVDLQERKSIGMFNFIKYPYLMFVGVSLCNIFNCNKEIKSKIQDYMMNGIESGVVRPLRKQLFAINESAEAFLHLRTKSHEEKTLVIVKPEIPCKSGPCALFDAEKTYLVVGSGSVLWLADIAEWLVQRGVKKLFLASTSEHLRFSSERRYKQLMSKSQAKIVTTSASQLSSQNAVDFFHDVELSGPLSAIFCIGLKEDSSILAALDAASRQLGSQLQHFVCLLGGSASVCEARARLGLPACLIQSESPLNKPQDVLLYLSSALNENNQTGQIFLISDQEFKSEKADTKLTQDPRNFLPTTIEELLTLSGEVSKKTTVQEMTTRCPTHENVKHNLLPVFVFPGTHSARLQTFIRYLMHPVYVATLPAKQQSVESFAEALLQEILSIQLQGPYNIVGESWSGPVAVHLALLLEARGQQVELFLVDAAVDSVQKYVLALCDRNISHLDITLLTTLLNLDVKTAKELAGLGSWEEQVDQSLKVVKSRLEMLPEEIQSVRKAVIALQNHLTSALAYRPPEKIKGGVHLIRPKGASDLDYCGLQMYSQQRPNVYVMMDEMHQDMVSLQACANIVNDNTLYSWDL